MRSLTDKIFCTFLVLEAQNIRFHSNFRGKKRGNMGEKLHNDYICLVESGKQQIKEIRENSTGKQRQLLSESGFVLRIAPPSLSRDRRIKMKKINKKKEIISCRKNNNCYIK